MDPTDDAFVKLGSRITKRAAPAPPAGPVANPANADRWVNSRLSFDASVWHRTARSAIPLNFIVAPGNPVNPSNPLTGDGIDDRNRNQLLQARSSAALRFGQARPLHPTEQRAYTHPEDFGPMSTVGSAGRQLQGVPIEADLAQSPFLPWRLQQLQEQIGHDWQRLVPAVLMCFGRVHEGFVARLLEQNVPPPFDGKIVFQRGVMLRMASMLFFREGAGTTGYNFSHVALQLNNSQQMWLMHATTYMNAAIADPRMFLFLYDVFYRGYLGGCEFRPVTDPESFDPTQPPTAHGDTMVFNIGGDTSPDAIEDPICLTGSPHRSQFPHRFLNPDRVFAPRVTFPSQLFYDYIFRFSEFATQAGDYSLETFDEERQSLIRVLPVVAFRGTQRLYDAATGKFSDERRGTSALADVEPPLKRIFDGTENLFDRAKRVKVI